MFISAASAISPQQSFPGQPQLATRITPTGNRFTCIEPSYADRIDPKLIRRMSRIIRMGVATAMDALQQAGITEPSAIITGTAYGCLEDTGIFLKKMVENQEEMLTPTAFIQSTHNTVGAQIALMLKCNAYNNTYVHRAHSFETALLDAMMLLKDDPAAAVLVGAADELTAHSFIILERFGLFRHHAAGEGAAFFVVKSDPANAIAELKGIRTVFNGDESAVKKAAISLLDEHTLQPADIGMVISGRTEDKAMDTFYNSVEKTLFAPVEKFYYKDLCGEYPTSTAFAIWMACSLQKDLNGRHMLLYNADKAGYHSLMLISRC